jgi:putative membrane protein
MSGVWLAALASTLHIAGISVTLGATFVRARLLARPLDDQRLRRVFAADSASGAGAMFIIGSGLWRALGGMEKAWAFYRDNGFFWVKMALLALVLLLELVPMVTLIRWRVAQGRGVAIDTRGAGRLQRISDIEVLLLFAILFVAPLMARGAWLLG